jgi:hypothetical protein
VTQLVLPLSVESLQRSELSAATSGSDRYRKSSRLRDDQVARGDGEAGRARHTGQAMSEENVETSAG